MRELVKTTSLRLGPAEVNKVGIGGVGVGAALACGEGIGSTYDNYIQLTANIPHPYTFFDLIRRN